MVQVLRIAAHMRREEGHRGIPAEARLQHRVLIGFRAVFGRIVLSLEPPVRIADVDEDAHSVGGDRVEDPVEARRVEEDDREDTEEQPRRRRGRRGGRRTRRKPLGALEATFDHGEEGYGLWLDPAVQDDPIYAEYWAGHRPVEVTIEEDQIVIRRTGENEDSDDEDA